MIPSESVLLLNIHLPMMTYAFGIFHLRECFGCLRSVQLSMKSTNPHFTVLRVDCMLDRRGITLYLPIRVRHPWSCFPEYHLTTAAKMACCSKHSSNMIVASRRISRPAVGNISSDVSAFHPLVPSTPAWRPSLSPFLSCCVHAQAFDEEIRRSMKDEVATSWRYLEHHPPRHLRAHCLTRYPR